MELYLMRHGIAEDAEAGEPDSKRKLTDEGRQKAEAVLRLARQGGLCPNLILSSPYVRAMQTAKIAGGVFRDGSPEIVPCDCLKPHSSPQNVWEELRTHSDARSILLTSHEPLLGHTVAFLLNSPGLELEIKKATILRIDLTSLRGAPRGVLHWMITPRLSSAELPS